MAQIMGGAKPQAVQAPVVQADPNAPPPRADISTTGFTKQFDAGEAFDFGEDYDPSQFASNFFTASGQGGGGINLPEGLGAGSKRGQQTAFNTLLDTLTTGGSVSEGGIFPSSGFSYLGQQGFSAQDQSAAGGLSALRELINRG